MSQPGNRKKVFGQLKEVVKGLKKNVQERMEQKIRETVPSPDVLMEQSEALARQADRFNRPKASAQNPNVVEEQKQESVLSGTELSFQNAMDEITGIRSTLENGILHAQSNPQLAATFNPDNLMKKYVEPFIEADKKASEALSGGAKGNKKFDEEREGAINALYAISKSAASPLSKLYLLELKIRERQQGWYCRFAMWLGFDGYDKLLAKHQENTEFLIAQLKILDTKKEVAGYSNLVEKVRALVEESTEQFDTIFKVGGVKITEEEKQKLEKDVKDLDKPAVSSTFRR